YIDSIDYDKRNEWEKNIILITDNIIDILRDKKININMKTIAEKSPKVFSRFLRNISIDEQLALVKDFELDILFRVLDETEYFPLIDFIEKEKAKEILYRISTSQRSFIMSKMKNPPIF
ncbi:MAG: hypothetical protein J7L54_01365, partial [Elusimicrobia bacterium]|nr:hypothetical protein [Elusimicrobiota bacterium]